MNYQRITVERMAGACGAEIGGVDLSKPLDAATAAEIRRALLENLVVVFRDQPLDDHGLQTFTRGLGEFGIEPYVEGTETAPHVVAVIKEADEVRSVNFGGNWHSDWSFQETPPAFTILHARQTPPFGGDTLFANQYLAWEALSPGLRAMLGGMRAMHSARRPYGPQGTYAGGRNARSMKISTGESALAEQSQPVVRVHAETGREALYVNKVYTIRFEDMTERESAPLLGFLCDHAVRPEFTCRVDWRPGTLTVWDNRCVQHFAINDYDGHRREMHRTTVRGEKPIATGEDHNRRAAE